jgi:hypothetical protein
MTTLVPQVNQTVPVVNRTRTRKGTNILATADKLKGQNTFRRAGKSSTLQLAGSKLKWNPTSARKDMEFIYCVPFRLGGSPAEVRQELTSSGVLTADVIEDAINGSLTSDNITRDDVGVYTDYAQTQNGGSIQLGVVDEQGNFRAGGAPARGVYEAELNAGKLKRESAKAEKTNNGETINLNFLLAFKQQMTASKAGTAVATTTGTGGTVGKKSRARPPSERLAEVKGLGGTKYLNVSDYDPSTNTGTRLVNNIPKGSVPLGNRGQRDDRGQLGVSDDLSYVIVDSIATKRPNAVAFLQQLYGWDVDQTNNYVQHVVTDALVNNARVPARQTGVQNVAVQPVAMAQPTVASPRSYGGVPMPVMNNGGNMNPVPLPVGVRTPTGSTPRPTPRAGPMPVPLPVGGRPSSPRGVMPVPIRTAQ